MGYKRAEEPDNPSEEWPDLSKDAQRLLRESGLCLSGDIESQVGLDASLAITNERSSHEHTAEKFEYRDNCSMIEAIIPPEPVVESCEITVEWRERWECISAA